MPSALPVMGEVAGSAAALAGLILVFLGAVSTAFDGYQKQEQRAVVGRYQRQAWLAFAGFVFSLASTVLALAAKWLSSECGARAAITLLVLGLIGVLFSALSAVREIR